MQRPRNGQRWGSFADLVDATEMWGTIISIKYTQSLALAASTHVSVHKTSSYCLVGLLVGIHGRHAGILWCELARVEQRGAVDTLTNFLEQ